MVKGTGKRVIVVKSPDPRVFEEAIFIIRDDFAAGGGVSAEEVIKQAEQAAGAYLKGIKGIAPRRRRWSFIYRLPAPVVAAAGAAATGLAWFASKLVV